ncbi:MAG: ferrous iron transport protein B [Lentimicrobiaceae bacterium]|nr:ferrous iron transport protein B [Lentimicrobiaceae bacterium]
MTLLDLEIGSKALITKVKGRGAFRKRITEMGFVKGQEVRAVQKAPMNDPIEYHIMGYNVSLRNSEARLIEIVTEEEAVSYKGNGFEGTLQEGEWLRRAAREKERHIHVALVGNPNSGKTTIFNHASGSRERVGNYGGVTVDAKEARFRLDGYTFQVVDLPGTYSLAAYSPEELYVRRYIYDELPDVVVNVVDASNLERNLYLTTQLIDMDVRVVVALNMFDDMERKGDNLDYTMLGKMLGIPFIPTVGSKGRGIDQLLRRIIEVYEDSDPDLRHIHINYGETIERGIAAIQEKIRIPENLSITDKISSRFLAIKLLEKDTAAIDRLQAAVNKPEILHTAEKERKRIEDAYQDDGETIITDAKYGFVEGALKQTLSLNRVQRKRKTEIVDAFITHKLWGIPIFLLFMWLTFFSTFRVGNYFMEWIEEGVNWLSALLYARMEGGWLKDLLIQGILGGVGGVIVFLPNIVILYFFIALMEDSGYMARAVFIMDKAMHRIGLHGKSFIPLLMGFGCNVPAILSTRMIESRRDRLVTMLINPFMSCSARLPVYILFISAFFASNQTSILFLIYGVGVSLAIFSALLFKRTLFRKVDIPFVMELPPYRVPTIRTLLKHMWHRAGQYLRKIGGVILVASIIIWALGYFPRHTPYDAAYQAKISALTAEVSLALDGKADRTLEQIEEELSQVNTEWSYERQRNSLIGQIGHAVEPIMRPLGFDWKMSVAIVTGVAAKEIVVGTLGVLYQADPDEVESGNSSLVYKLREQVYQEGSRKGEYVFRPLVALAFMFFILIYFPCIAVISAISRESGSWKYAAFTVFYTTGMAWFVSFLVFQIGSLLGY